MQTRTRRDRIVSLVHDDPEIQARRWWTLVVLCLSLVMVILGNTVLNVAIPTLQRELDASATQLQWIVDSYALVFAGLLLTCGALGDRFGRKGALTAGLLIFGAASLTASQADSANQLIALRAVMGLGAALVMPATLSILTNVFPPKERPKAIGIWAGLAGAGAAIGPIASGYLLEHFSWGSVFLVNIPVVIAAVVAGRYLVPKSKDEDAERLDPVGAGLSIVGLAMLLYAIIEAPLKGWASVETIGIGAVAITVLAAFGLWELRTAHPMLDLRHFKNRAFSSASAAITLVFFSMFGTFFLMTQYLQLVLGYTALGAGVRLLPMSFVMMFAAPNSARLVAKHGVRTVMATGLAVVAVGVALLSRADANTPYWYLILSLGVMAVGMGSTMAPATTAIMASLPLGKAGVGSAVNDTTRELGGALGVAVLGSILNSGYTAGVAGAAVGLPDAVRSQVESTLGAAVAVGQNVPGLADAARAAYVDGMSTAMVLAAGVVLLASALVARFMPSVERVDELAALQDDGRQEDEIPSLAAGS
jgi:EmrB/QacA subfamily drug resistance transporter